MPPKGQDSYIAGSAQLFRNHSGTGRPQEGPVDSLWTACGHDVGETRRQTG